MKNNTYRWMVLLWVLIHSTLSFAYDVEVNGIYYNLNTNLRKAEVTNGTTKYRGIVDIPATINDGGTTYSVTNIGKFAFEGCYSLTSVTIPNGVTTIDNYAFSGCTGMTSITIPNSVTNFIGSYVFNGCSGLASIHVESGNTIYDSRGDCNAIIETSTNTLKFGCKNTIIPNSVTTIGECAFNSCTGLTSITIPSSVTKFNSYAFWQCSGLTAVHITDLAAWYKISFSVYSNPLQYAHHLYLNGKEVKDLVIPSSVTTIGSYAFEGCVGLTSVTIPNSITSIEESAFASCSGLTQVTIPNSVTYIGRGAFSHCSGLTQVTIPNSVTNIGSYAFNSCTRLASVTIPCNVSAIGDVAFYGCSKMNFVKSEIESPFGISDKVFGNISSNATLQVPKGTKSKYEELSSWTTNFQTIIEDENSGPTTFTLSITASGNGSVSYNSTSVRNNMQSFTVNSGTSATVSFSPDTGYRIACVKVNNTNVTSSVSNNKYTISNITANTTLAVTFEAIPVTTYSLTISSSGSGSTSYNGTVIRGGTQSFTVNSGASATVTFSPDSGYKIASVKENNTDVTSSVSNNQYTISNITANTTLTVTYQSTSSSYYTLTITASGNGKASLGTSTTRNGTTLYSFKEGSPIVVTFTPDSGNRLAKVTMNDIDVTSNITNNQFIINAMYLNVTLVATFEEIPVTKYTLTISSSANGSAEYNGTTIRGGSQAFTVNEGTSATVSFTPDNGYRIASVKVNNSDVTSSLSNNKYTISDITANTTLAVTFEAIPPTTYTLSITASGNGNATYNSTAIKNQTQTFTVNEGTSATVSFTPDNGYRIASVKVNNSDVTSSVSNSKYTISNISANTTLSVTFEVIPPTTYTLSITASGYGNATYNNTSVRGKTQSFTVNEGTSATVTFSPDSGYRIANVKVNNTDVTSSVSNNKYTISNISANTTLSVTFEAIPPTTYTLSITASGNGSATYNSTTIKNKTQSFTVNEGTSATVTFTPDSGYRIASVKVNNTDVTSNVTNNKYTISNITANTTIVVAFEEEVTALTVDGVNYSVVSQTEKTVKVATGNYGQVLTVPATVTQNGKTWTVTGISNDALKDCKELAAVIWNASAAFTATLSNPNLLLYVKSDDYVPAAIKNVVVNGTANSITLTEAASGNNFYCPQAFTARSISFTHRYSMTTGIGESRGWETLALPFDVQSITHETKGDITPFANRKSGDANKPFWLYELTGSGFVEAASIKAYTPYIISMPNNPQYDSQWLLSGSVTFAASNVTVGKTENVNMATYRDRTFVPNFVAKGAGDGLYALNVNNDYTTNESGMTEGSKFVLNMRTVHPFEAYMTTASNARQVIDVFEDMTTDIKMLGIWEQCGGDDGDVYDLQGRKVSHMTKGVYVGKKGQKYIIK